MVNVNRQVTSPVQYPRSTRTVGVRALTSLPAGKIVPLAAHGLLREDSARGQYNISFEMLETAELLMNATYVDVKAYLVPFLCFARFNKSMDQLNRSYMGKPLSPGEAVTPFFVTATKGAHGAEAIYKYMGLHADPGDTVNTMFAEAYNEVVNFRYRQRSPDIALRTALDYTLAPALWRHENFSMIVPDFDDAVINGEVDLNVVDSHMPVSGIGFVSPYSSAASQASVRDGDGTTDTFTLNRKTTDATATPIIRLKDVGAGVLWPDIYAELQQGGITVSLANIEQAKKTQAFARIREQYTELVDATDEFVLNLLMSGITIPDQALKQPILLAEKATVFGQAKRYSTDADALSASATNGGATVSLDVRVPRLNTGGVIVVTAEVTPEQLFERKRDYFFYTTSVATLPEAVRDTLDAQKVEEVPNAYVDVNHGTPAGVFGYAPLHYQLQGVDYKIGGKFYRPAVDLPADDERQRLWAVETANPTLSTDFYLATTIHQKPFLDTTADPFEAVTIGMLSIEGNTQFGPPLVEALNNYEEVMEKAPTDIIEP